MAIAAKTPTTPTAAASNAAAALSASMTVSKGGGKPADAPKAEPKAETPKAETVSQASAPAPTVTETQPEAPAAVAATEQPAAPVAVVPPAAVVPVAVQLSLADVLSRARKVVMLSEKVTQIETQLTNLEAFRLGSTDHRDTLLISDGTGRKFETSKTPLVQKLLDVLQFEIRTAYDAAAEELRSLMNA